jgi:Zn-dependent oligopeptidase
MARMMKKYENLGQSRDLYKQMKERMNEQMTEKEKNKNMDIINILVDAVVASGKKFNEIPKESIFAYLDKAGIGKSKWQSTYDTLASNFKETVPIVKKIEQSHTQSKTELKQRQPRKSIFSEIKKITP